MNDLRAARRFVLGMVAFAALLTIGWQLDVTHQALAPIAVWNASMTSALLEWQGVEVLRRGSSLHHAGGFSCQIDLACTGLPILALVVAAVALYPATRRLRVRALAIALPLMFAVNLFRLVHLVRVGIETPEWFDFAHDVAWRVALTLLFAAGWILWRQRAQAEKPSARSPDEMLRIPSFEPEGALAFAPDDRVGEVPGRVRDRSRSDRTRPSRDAGSVRVQRPPRYDIRGSLSPGPPDRSRGALGSRA